jgi:hypothetical protein
LTLSPDFWNKAEEAQKVQREHGQIKDVIREWEDWCGNLDEYELLLEMASE